MDEELLARVSEYLSHGQPQQALNLIQEPLAQEPENPLLYRLVGLIARGAGDQELAVVHLTNCLKLDPHDTEAYENLLDALKQLGRERERADLIIQARDRQMYRRQDAVTLAEYYAKKGKPFEAMAEISRALDHFGPDPGLVQELKKSCQGYVNTTIARVFTPCEPFIYIAQGHSATNYVRDELVRRLKVYCGESLNAGDDEEGGAIDQNELEAFMRTGGFIRARPFPSPINIATLNECGIRKIFLTARDPRQVVLSEAHWNDEVLRRKFKYEIPCFLSRIDTRYPEWDFEKKLDHWIEFRLPSLVTFLQGWMEVSKRTDLNFQFKIFLYEDMKANDARFFQDIVEFLGFQPEQLSGEVYHSKAAKEGVYGEHAFRAGSVDEWRTALSPAQMARVNELVPRSLLDDYGWKY